MILSTRRGEARRRYLYENLNMPKPFNRRRTFVCSGLLRFENRTHNTHINIINQISLNDVYVYVSPWATENANLLTENGIRNPFLKLKNDNQSNSWKWEVEVGYGDGDGVGSANCGLSKQQLWLSFVLPWGVLFIGLDLSYICIC